MLDSRTAARGMWYKRFNKYVSISFAPHLSTSVSLIITLVALSVNYSIFIKTTPAHPGNPPLIVYRHKNGDVRLCVIPRACECAGAGKGCPPGNKGPLYIHERYRDFDNVLAECTKNLSRRFYHGEVPMLRPMPVLYDSDIVGRSMTSVRYKHFPHLVQHLAGQVIVPASLFLNRQHSSLSHPNCLRPGSTILSQCTRNEISGLNPRLLVSRDTMGPPRKWNFELFKLLTTGTKRDNTSRLRKVRVVYKGATHECFRSLIFSPESFDVSKPGHDTLLSEAGVKRTPKCKPHVVLVTRDRNETANRSVLPGFVSKVISNLNRFTNASVESVVGLGHLGFLEQIAVMQRADVFVGVHGAELSNALFLRQNVSVIEIHPFGYFSKVIDMPPFGNYSVNCFGAIFRAVHAKYTPLTSAPDSERFMKCSKRYPQRDPGFKGRAQFKKRLAQYKRAITNEQRITASKFQILNNGAAGCARSQVIDVDPETLARIIFAEIRKKCHTT